MYTFLIVFIPVVIFALFVAWNQIEPDSFLTWAWAVFIGLFYGGTIGGFGGLAVAGIVPSTTVDTHQTFNIENLQDNSSVSGSFFLGMGPIDGTMNYVYYYSTGEGFKMAVVPYSKAVIKYSSNKPHVDVLTKTQTEQSKKWSILNCRKPHKYIIYVPKGTIQNNFQLDAR